MLPSQMRVILFDDFLLLLEAKRKKELNNQQVIRYQTALLAEVFTGKGNGVRFVMESWKMGEDSQEMTVEQIREVLKKKKERDVLKKLKSK
jgi:hypothetical protein